MLSKLKPVWQCVTFSIYVILLCVIIARHEPWFDEAQAWLLARDSSLYGLLFEALRYEGTPGLWHLILMLPAKAGLPYISLNIIAGAIASFGTYLFLRHSPFPGVIKALYPFTYFAFYQYAAVARSYVLLPPVLFLIAADYRERLRHPFRFAILLMLLANISLHGFIIAMGLAAVCFFDFIKRGMPIDAKTGVKNLAAFTAFGVMAVLIALQLKPAPDIITPASFRHDLGSFYDKTLWIFSDALVTNVSAPAAGPELFYGLCRALYCALVPLTFLWLMVRKSLRIFLVPFLGIGALFTAVYVNVWHQGVLFFLWLFALWVSFEPGTRSSPSRRLKSVISVCLLLVFSVQIYWAANAFLYDCRYSYSSAKEAAEYIKSNGLDDKKIYMTGFHPISVLAYFDDNIFCNYNQGQKPCYWLWSDRNSIYREPYLNLAKYQPDYILMGVKHFTKKRVDLDLSMLPGVPGYRVIRYFNGSVYWKERPFELDSFALFERTGG